jgi:hypothetical protein
MVVNNRTGWLPRRGALRGPDCLTSLATGEPIPPTFREALATEHVTDAVLKSAKTEQWERVKKAG